MPQARATSEPHPLLDRKAASAYLSISPRKLDSLVADGELPRIKIGTSVRFEKCDLDAYIIEKKTR